MKRRSVLRSVAVGAGAIGAGTFGATLGSSGNGTTTQDKQPTGVVRKSNIYTGPALELDFSSTLDTQTLSTADKLTKGDVVLLSAETDIKRDTQIGVLEDGASVGFVGDGAEEKMISTVTNERPSSLAETDGTDVTIDSDLPFRVGFEHAPEAPSVSAAIVPDENVLDTYVRRGDLEAPIGTLDAEAKSRETATQTVTLLNTILKDIENPSEPGEMCPDGFDCLGAHHDSGETSWGEWALEIEGGELVLDDDWSYMSFESVLQMKPKTSSLWLQQPTNSRMMRSLDFSEASLRDAGPESQSFDGSQSISVGVSSSGVSASWEWSESINGYEISVGGSITDDEIEHTWNNFSGNEERERIFGRPGYRTKVEGDENAGYSATSIWSWHKSPMRYSDAEIESYGAWIAQRNEDDCPICE